MNKVYKKLLLDGVKEHKLGISLILAAVLLTKLASMSPPFILKIIIDKIPSYQTAVDGFNYLPLLAITYATCFFSATIFEEIKEYFSQKLIQPQIVEVGTKAFNSLINLPEEFSLTNKSGAVMRDIDRGLKSAQSLATLIVHTILPTFLEVILVTIYCFIFYDLWISITIFMGVILYSSLTILGSKVLTEQKELLNSSDSEGAAKLGEAITNSETIKLFRAEEYETKQYSSLLTSYSDKAIRYQFLHAKFRSLQQVVIAIVLSAILVQASFLAMNHKMSAGDFVLLNALVMQILMPISFLGYVWKEALRFTADIKKLSDIFEYPSTPIIEGALKENVLLTAPSVEFRGVSFSYLKDQEILRDVSFSIPRGKVIALVGGSGSGKTTIAKLLLGFLDPSTGSIVIDGKSTTLQERQVYREYIGVVPQNVVLFHGTISANIAYGKRDATQSEIEMVAQETKIDSLINALPMGYETEVGERGLKLSGGERQMMGIARALIKNPVMLVLDEASSSLDSISEAKFIEGALKAKGDRTCLIIAHRLSTIKTADEIIVLEGGTVVERGSHDVLLVKNGIYASLWHAQSSSH